MDDLELVEEDDFDELENDGSDPESDHDNLELDLLEDEDGTENNEDSQKITFDISLPTSHAYLCEGNDWQEVTGRTVHEDGAELDLPVLSLPGVVLMPGQVLPLCLFRNEDMSMIRHCLENDRTFGHLTRLPTDAEGYNYKLGKIGTTAEILAVKETSMSFKLKTVGRQRFEVLETRSNIRGVLIARVKILPEKEMTNLLHDVCPNSYRKFLPSPRFLGLKASGEAIDKEDILMNEIADQLLNWNNSYDMHKVPENPSTFSYWVASTLPLDDFMRLEILGIHSAEQRLRCELSIMKKCTVMCCKVCLGPVAKQVDVFSMSTDGPLGTYVNPGGVVHETLTVHHTTGLELIGRPSTQSSWFPGYAWTITQCVRCHSHMGWRFTCVKKDSNLKPEKFWGLCRSSLTPSLKTESDEPFHLVL